MISRAAWAMSVTAMTCSKKRFGLLDTALSENAARANEQQASSTATLAKLGKRLDCFARLSTPRAA